MVSAALATLGGIPLRTNPNEIRWNFQMKTAETRTMGGKVIQILGTTLSDLTIRGRLGPGLKDRGDKEGWENQLRFYKQVQSWTKKAADTERAQPIRFTYSPRNWDFKVFVRALNPVALTVQEINPLVELVLFPVDDGATAIIDGAKDLYIARLSDGVGWKQTEYNGPTQAEVNVLLTPFSGSAHDYLENQFVQDFTGSSSKPGVLPGGQQG